MANTSRFENVCWEDVISPDGALRLAARRILFRNTRKQYPTSDPVEVAARLGLSIDQVGEDDCTSDIEIPKKSES